MGELTSKIYYILKYWWNLSKKLCYSPKVKFKKKRGWYKLTVHTGKNKKVDSTNKIHLTVDFLDKYEQGKYLI